MDFEKMIRVLNDEVLWKGKVLKSLYEIYGEGQKRLTYQFEKDRLEEHLRGIADAFDLEVEDDG